ncbi:MAG: type IX secretion system protein PorQ [Ekhidna sp.]|uniref:type IX secretion system protein PorQ n=1 Tax=Ekhidna sp. TaxID=2608089 RepID=UPI0032F06773
MKILAFIALIIPSLVWSQIGGLSGYQSLNLTTNPRAAALGGTTISLADGDLSQFFENPATLDSVGVKNIFFHFNPYFADVFVYSGAYTFNVGKAGTFATGINYVNYGSFDLTDEAGNQLGTFQSQDYTIAIGKAHQLGPITLGANVKLAHSSIESYGSTAVLMDVGGVFRINKNWTVAMVFENIGVRISEFSDFSSPNIPFDVKLGTSFKPEYMPLRFTMTTNNLVDENSTDIEDEAGRASQGIDKVWKRVNLGAEVLLSDNFQLLIGYNHKRKQELRLDDIGGGAGLSFGAMVRVKRIELRFSRATFHAAGGSSFISLRTDLNDFKKIL